MKLLHRYTVDGLNLLGGYWEGTKEKDTCVVFTHGMFDNLIENVFASVLGEELSKKGYGFIFGHNRGHGVINSLVVRDSVSRKTQIKIIGSTFEKFGESIYDVDLWVEEAKKLGYSKIILCGHSLGCLKNLYYINKKGMGSISGVIFLSAPDSCGLINRSDEYKKLFAEAEKNIRSRKSKRILSKKLLGVFPISSRTYYDFRKGSCLDIFPLVENPEEYSVLKKINKPMLTILAENDSVIVRGAEEDLKIIQEKSSKCHDFTGKIIKNATHRYVHKEQELSHTIVNWLEERF